MADKKETTREPQAESGEQSGSAGETIINSVARTVGSAMGTIASSTAKVLNASDRNESKESREGKSKRQASAGDKFSDRRKASKKRKRAAHKRKLKRSSSRG